MTLINMIAFILTFHCYTNQLELMTLGTAANDYDGNNLRRMEMDYHYYYSRVIVIDRCDDSSGSAAYDDGDGRRDCDREHDHVRDQHAHDYCGDEYYFSSY